MIRIAIKNKDQTESVQLPDHWDELTQEQMKAVAGLILTANFASEDPDEKAGELLTNIAFALVKGKKKHFANISPEIFHENILPLLGWLKEEITLTKQLFPTLKPKNWGAEYFGPADELANIRFAEFDFSERCLYDWHQNKDNKMLLWLFVACLYRPAKKKYNHHLDPDGDCREPFSFSASQKLAEIFCKNLDWNVALAIMLWYKGCRKRIAAMHPIVFNNTGKGGGEEIPAYFGIMRRLAKDGIYGSFEAVESMLLHTALMEIAICITDAEKTKETHETF